MAMASLGASLALVLYLSDELSLWQCHDNSTINIVVTIIITITNGHFPSAPMLGHC